MALVVEMVLVAEIQGCVFLRKGGALILIDDQHRVLAAAAAAAARVVQRRLGVLAHQVRRGRKVFGHVAAPVHVRRARGRDVDQRRARPRGDERAVEVDGSLRSHARRLADVEVVLAKAGVEADVPVSADESGEQSRAAEERRREK